MLHLIWSIINIGVLITFLVICFRATTFVREKIGLGASLFFVIGLLSFAGNSGNKNGRNNDGNLDNEKWVYMSTEKDLPDGSSGLSLTLEENLCFEVNMLAQYVNEPFSGKILAAKANTSLLGFVGGFAWEQTIADFYPTSDPKKVNFFIVGSLKWKLMGITFYHQSKTFRGSIPAN